MEEDAGSRQREQESGQDTAAAAGGEGALLGEESFRAVFFLACIPLAGFLSDTGGSHAPTMGRECGGFEAACQEVLVIHLRPATLNLKWYQSAFVIVCSIL